MGDSLLKMAQADPQSNFLGIEVHRPGVGKVLRGITQHNLQNLKIMCHDATEVIANCFDLQSVDRLLIFFPDPWPKKRHHKRRIIQAEFVELLATRLAEGGALHLATDWEAYAHMEGAETSLRLSIALEQGTTATCLPGRKQNLNNGPLPGAGVWDLCLKRPAFNLELKPMLMLLEPENVLFVLRAN